MPRLIVFIIVLLLLAGGLYFLSTMATEQPTRTIEVEVPQGGNAQ
jgi:hypothetical protein